MATARRKAAQQISRQCIGSAEKPSIPRMAISLNMMANGALYSPSGSPMSKAVQKSHSVSGAIIHPSAMPSAGPQTLTVVRRGSDTHS